MLGFIGTGNMASAIINGLVSSGMLKGNEIAVFDVMTEKAEALKKQFDVAVFESENQIASQCSQVVLSVKPNVFPSLLGKISEDLKKNNPLIISIAAGKTLGYIASLLGYEAKIIRVMPNINAAVHEAVSAYCGNKNVSDCDFQFAERFCSSFGRAIALPEEQFPVFGVIGGCSPAFAYMFIDAMARAAVKNGMPKKQALEVSAQAVLGSAKLILESSEHPYELIDRVCSPGGTTIEGVLTLQKEGFEAAVADAVQAAVEKDKKL